MKINSDVVQLLSQIGFLACLKGETENGKVIMDSVEMHAEYYPSAMIGVAISRIYTGQYEEAISTLKNKILNLEPDNIFAKAFLGIALNKSGQYVEASALFKEIVVQGDTHNEAVARFYVGQIEGGNKIQSVL